MMRGDSLYTDRTQKTVAALIVVYSVVCGAFELAWIASGLIPANGFLRWDIQEFTRDPLRDPFNILDWWCQLSAIVGFVCSLLLWHQPLRYQVVVRILCAFAGISAVLAIVTYVRYWFRMASMHYATVEVLVQAAISLGTVCVQSVYASWFLLWKPTMPRRAAVLAGGLLAITAVGDAGGGILFIAGSDFAHWPQEWRLRETLSALVALELLAGAAWLLYARRGHAIGPMIFLLSGQMFLIFARAAYGDEIYLTLAGCIQAAQRPILALAFLIFALRYTGWVLETPVCLQCGYNLRGAPSDSCRCPECGASLTRYEPMARSEPRP